VNQGHFQNMGSNIASLLINAMKAAMGIQSPSTVAKGIGKNFGEGLADGIEGQVRAVQTAAGKLSDAATLSLTSGMSAPRWLPKISDGIVDLGEVSQKVWDALLSLGWKGNPNDDAERLYSPTGRKPRWATELSDGIVNLGDVSQKVWDALLKLGWKGNPNDQAERLYSPRLAQQFGQTTAARTMVPAATPAANATAAEIRDMRREISEILSQQLGKMNSKEELADAYVRAVAAVFGSQGHRLILDRILKQALDDLGARAGVAVN
jgi:hypothetical protein